MGVGRLLFWAVAGPTLFYWVLLGHVFCRMWYQTPGPVEIQDFPKGTTKAEIDKIVASRKAIIEAAKEAIAGNITTEFVNDFMTKDGSFEDVWMLYRVKKEDRLFFHYSNC